MIDSAPELCSLFFFLWLLLVFLIVAYGLGLKAKQYLGNNSGMSIFKASIILVRAMHFMLLCQKFRMSLSKYHTAKANVYRFVRNQPQTFAIKFKHFSLYTQKFPLYFSSFSFLKVILFRLISDNTSAVISFMSRGWYGQGLVLRLDVEEDEQDSVDERSIIVVEVGKRWQQEQGQLGRLVEARVQEDWVYECFGCLVQFLIGSFSVYNYLDGSQICLIIIYQWLPYFDLDFAFNSFSLSLCFALCSLECSLSFTTLSLSLFYLDLDLVFFFDLDLFLLSFFSCFVKYCLLKERVFWEFDLLSWGFFGFYLLELTILPSQLIRARLSEKLIFFIMLDILLLTPLLDYDYFPFSSGQSKPYSWLFSWIQLSTVLNS